MTISVPLSRPIQAHGDEITALELREPTGKDIRIIGMPMSIGADESVTMLAAPVARYIATLAQIPASSVDALHPADFMSIATVVLGFFGAAESPKTS